MFDEQYSETHSEEEGEKDVMPLQINLARLVMQMLPNRSAVLVSSCRSCDIKKISFDGECKTVLSCVDKIEAFCILLHAGKAVHIALLTRNKSEQI